MQKLPVHHVKNENTTTMCEICSKLTVKARFGCEFSADFLHESDLSTVDFDK